MDQFAIVADSKRVEELMEAIRKNMCLSANRNSSADPISMNLPFNQSISRDHDSSNYLMARRNSIDSTSSGSPPKQHESNAFLFTNNDSLQPNSIRSFNRSHNYSDHNAMPSNNFFTGNNLTGMNFSSSWNSHLNQSNAYQLNVSLAAMINEYNNNRSATFSSLSNNKLATNRPMDLPIPVSGNNCSSHYPRPSRNRRRAPSCLECVFCKNNGSDPDQFRNHILKDPEGIIVCPVLRKYNCPICQNGGGDFAHTIRYCPLNRPQNWRRNSWKQQMLSSTNGSAYGNGFPQYFS